MFKIHWHWDEVPDKLTIGTPVKGFDAEFGTMVWAYRTIVPGIAAVYVVDRTRPWRPSKDVYRGELRGYLPRWMAPIRDVYRMGIMEVLKGLMKTALDD
ncbi:hypothetical protein ACJU26_08680 [Acidithiobacillus sp. M4-SHS-6]|uniref:hypothetical protein n=1 Tax=Acidithiobacillus sp. M4-SHS-6 TaxID=3383024 RepID=UPI0039BDE657